MGDWSRNLAVGESIFLVVAAVLFFTGLRVSFKAWREKQSPWKRSLPWFLACFSLVFVRHYALEQETFRAPSAAVQKHVEKVPELVEGLQKVNDGFFHYGILLGIPAAFLLGYLFHMVTGMATRLVFRIPIFLVGCLALFVIFQIVSKRADGVAEALGNLWAVVTGLRKS